MERDSMKDFDEGLALAFEWGMGEFELRKKGLWLDEALKIMKKYGGMVFDWGYVNNWGRLSCKIGRG